MCDEKRGSINLGNRAIDRGLNEVERGYAGGQQSKINADRYASGAGQPVRPRDYRERVRMELERSSVNAENAVRTHQDASRLLELIDAHPEFAEFWQLAMRLGL